MTVFHPSRASVRVVLLACLAGTACTGSQQEEVSQPPAPGDAVALSKASEQLAGITVEAVSAEAIASELEAVGTVALDDGGAAASSCGAPVQAVPARHASRTTDARDG